MKVYEPMFFKFSVVTGRQVTQPVKKRDHLGQVDSRKKDRFPSLLYITKKVAYAPSPEGLKSTDKKSQYFHILLEVRQAPRKESRNPKKSE